MRLIRYLRSTLEEADRLTTKERLIENDDEQQHDERNRGDTGSGKSHKLVVNNRKTSLVTGVLDVLSFDLNEILLETEQGMLMVKGTDLHVNRLSLGKGEVDLYRKY